MEMDIADKMSERICLEQLQRGREARLVCEVKSSNYIPVKKSNFYPKNLSKYFYIYLSFKKSSYQKTKISNSYLVKKILIL
jgi:hypothetical protein